MTAEPVLTVGSVVRQTWMGNRVVGRRLRVPRRELIEFWSCARAENVAALVVLKDDHDRMRKPANVGGRPGPQWNFEHFGRGDGNDPQKNEAHADNAGTAADTAMACVQPSATMSPVLRR
jgi:hypothetical protein